MRRSNRGRGQRDKEGVAGDAERSQSQNKDGRVKWQRQRSPCCQVTFAFSCFFRAEQISNEKHLAYHYHLPDVQMSYMYATPYKVNLEGNH